MSDIGIPVTALRQMATGQLLRVVHTILAIVSEQVDACPPVLGEAAPGTPPGLFCGPTLLGTPGSPEVAETNVDAERNCGPAELVSSDRSGRPGHRGVPCLPPCASISCAFKIASCADSCLNDWEFRAAPVASPTPPSSSSLANDAAQEGVQKRRRLRDSPPEC